MRRYFEGLELRAAPKLHTYLELVKPEKTIFYWLNALAGGFLASAFLPPVLDTLKTLLAVGFTTFSIYVLNDVCDEDVDRINKPDRPLPSGRISRAEAMGLVLALFAMGVAVASTLNPIVLLCTMIYFLLGVAYSANPLRLKRGILANPCMALGAAICVICGAAPLQITYRVLWAAAGMFFFITVCGSGKDMKDVEGDRRMGVKTLPVMIGEEKTMKIFTVNSILAFTLFFSGCFLYSFNSLYPMLLTVAAVIYGKNLKLMWQNPKDPENCENAFNKLVPSAIIIVLAFVLGSLNISI